MKGNIRASHWMQDLAEKYPDFKKTRINELLIPGSHDSGTSRMSISARTQALTIKEQLEHGIRYLDIRPRVHNSTFYVHHSETGPDGSADLGHYSKGFKPENAANNKYIFKQIRDFLIDHPGEILILKFQNYSEFKKQDYFDLIEMIKAYFTFSTPGSHCQIARFDHGTGAYIRQESIDSLIQSGKRVFIIWSTTDVPTGEESRKIWDFAFKFTPSLKQHTPYNLWDPYWHDESDSLADDKDAKDFERWWAWHEKNRAAWAARHEAGFFVLQSQMQQLPLPLGAAEASAQRNNGKNMQQYIHWAHDRKMNVMSFDFVNYGNLCSHVINFYDARYQALSQSLAAEATAG